jgi:MFS family permease
MFSVFTGLCAVAQGYWDLLAYRTLAGMGLGGEFGIGMALIAEVWPASKRNRASAWVGIGWQLGVLLAAFITPLLLDIIGWRGMFLVGLLPALVSFAIRRGMGSPTRLPKISQSPNRSPSRPVSGCCLPTAPPRRPVSGSSSSARYRILATTA